MFLENVAENADLPAQSDEMYLACSQSALHSLGMRSQGSGLAVFLSCRHPTPPLSPQKPSQEVKDQAAGSYTFKQHP